MKFLPYLFICAAVVGCSTVYDFRIDMRFQVQVVDSNGAPIRNAEIWFRDSSVPQVYKSHLPSAPICVTSGRGSCVARVKYKYSTVDDLCCIGRRARGPRPELAATVHGTRSGQVAHVHATNEQLAGLEEIVVRIAP